MNIRAALGCGDPREYRGILCWKSPEVSEPEITFPFPGRTSFEELALGESAANA